MATLLLRLAAPLQSWGADSKFETRKTNREPTKSGVIGLLAAALGLRRDDTQALEELAKLKFGVRVEREGSLLVDFHTAITAKGTSYITYRHYLQDAVFLAGFESEDEELMSKLAEALTHPEYPLFLGRRSCPPTLPLCLGIREKSLAEALEQEEDLLNHNTYGKKIQSNEIGKRRILIDASPQDQAIGLQQDVPLSYSPMHRQYGYRFVKDYMVEISAGAQSTTEHDPFSEL